MNFTNTIKDLEMGKIILDYPDGPNVNLRVFTGGRQENQRKEVRGRKQRLERCTLKMRAGAICQGMGMASRSWKRKGFSSRASRYDAAVATLVLDF